MAWVPAPVNSPWRGQVYKRDAEQEARLDDKLSAARAAAEARAARPLTETEIIGGLLRADDGGLRVGTTRR